MDVKMWGKNEFVKFDGFVGANASWKPAVN